MGADRATTYKRALATFESADAEVRRLVEAVMRDGGERGAVVTDWRRIVPEVDGKTFGCASWLHTYRRVNITALPHAGELISALGTWHTAKMIVTNAWLQMGEADRARAPPLPAQASPG
jgi:hypothetical protein